MPALASSPHPPRCQHPCHPAVGTWWLHPPTGVVAGSPCPPHDQERCPHAVPRPRWPLRSQRWCLFLLGRPESRHCPLLGTVPCVGDECRHLLCHCWSRPSCGIWSCGWLSPTLGDRGHGVSSRLVTCGVWGSSPRSQRGGDPVAPVGTIPVTPIPLRLSPCSCCASVSPRDRAGGDSVAGGWLAGTCTATCHPRGRAQPRTVLDKRV